MRRSPPRSGVGVLDRCVAILGVVEDGAHTFTDIAQATGLTRSTTHRLILGLEDHGLLVHIGGFGYVLGPRLLALARHAIEDLPLRELAHPSLERLARTTGESAQLYVRNGDRRVCIDAVESENELRTIVGVGTELPITAGSAGKIFLAFDPGAGTAELIA
ncbi:MAG: IclR family transcriptional regulator, partial [Gemmatimonadota bacterium]